MTPQTRANLVQAGSRAVAAALARHGVRGRRLKEARALDAQQDALAGVAFVLKSGVAAASCPPGGVLVVEAGPVSPLPVPHLARRGIAGVLSAVPLRQAREIVRAPLRGFSTGRRHHRRGRCDPGRPARRGRESRRRSSRQVAEEAVEAMLFEEFTADQVAQGGGVYGLHIPSGDRARPPSRRGAG